MWGTDLTSTLTGEGQASIFVTVDHCSTECVGIHAARRATRFEALEPLRQALRTGLGAFAEGVAGGLKLRHDPVQGCGDPAPHRLQPVRRRRLPARTRLSRAHPKGSC
jgi:hypothetical protein